MFEIPYKAKSLVLTVLGVTMDVVEGASIELEKEGGVEGYYGSATGKHAIGMKKGTFSIRRWLKDNSDPDLLYDLFDGEVPFNLSGEISGVSNSTLTLSDCIIYRHRWVMGGVNDIIAEESSGEACGYSSTIA